jgi:PmbA protein
MRLQELAERALELAARAGAGQASAKVTRSRFSDVGFRDGELDKAEASARQSLGLRLFVEGRYAGHSTSDLRPEALEAFVDRAVELTRLLEPDPDRGLPAPERHPRPPGPELELYDPAVAAADDRRWVELARRLEELARRRAGEEGLEVASVTGAAYGETSSTVLATSTGFAGRLDESGDFAGCSVAIRDPGERAKRRSGSWWAGFRRAGRLEEELEGLAAEAVRRAREAAGAAPRPGGRWPVVVENQAGGKLVGYLAGALSGEAVWQKRSYLAGGLGRPVASPVLTLRDRPLLPGGFGSRWFDGEGLAAQELAVISGGELKAFYLDTYHARKLGMEPTSGSRSNLELMPTAEGGLAGLLSRVDRGLLVTGFPGGSFNPTTGDFSLGVAGQWLEGGEPAGAVEGMNLAGNARELWEALREVADDPYPYAPVRCPSLLFGELRLGGA